MKYFSFLFFVILTLLSIATFAQDAEQLSDEDLYSLSLEELMNVPIKSASKKEETLFDAPLSSYTITRAEIDRAGSTSIMEALRLAPGVIVREQANGVYDIHIRGMEDLTRNNGVFFKANAYTLVMIDNRPVFNHALGGTFWESLPVDINDVDRIEIVRGPSSPMFGPNAVTGVINIITKRMNKTTSLVTANVQRGTSGTTIANTSIGQSFGKFSAIVTGNLQDRQRFDNNYYDQTSGTYVPVETLVSDPATRNLRYPYPTRSLNKWGVNGYLTYKASEKVSVDLSVSNQAAASQRVFTTNPLQYAQMNNFSVNLAATVHALKIRTSYLKGYNADNKNSAPQPDGEYDFSVSDVTAEYDIKAGKDKKYTITPGVSYQDVHFDDLKYYVPQDFKYGYFNNNVSINTVAGFIRSDLNFTSRLRVMAAIRVDKFSTPDKAYLAHELAGTYKLGGKNLVRIAWTRSNSGSFIGYNYLNFLGQTTGNQNLKVFTLEMLEVGYRTQLTSNLQFDIDVFRQTAKNLTALVATDLAGHSQFENTPTTATQIGSTISINFVPSEKIQLKPFVTFQRTETKDFPSMYVSPGVLPVTYSDSKHTYTPGTFGGFYFNYRPVTRLNVSLSSYFYSSQGHYDQSVVNATATPNQYAQAQIAGKVMMNAKVSYDVLKGLQVYVNARNLFNADSHEFYAADKTQGLYLAGASFNINK